MPILHHLESADLPVVSTCDGWTIHEYPSVASTNLVAAGLPAWTAVRANSQTAGRGRFQRTWVSDLGGLWLSAVVPTARNTNARRTLPLAAGLAICNSLRELGVSGLRLRWPNDVLVKDQKLAGLLIDQFSPDVAVVGIGLNVANQPETCDPALRNRTTRLADLLPSQPELMTLTALVLRNVQKVLTDLDLSGAAALFSRVNALWAGPRMVELDLDGTLARGLFTGVDETGRLVLSDSEGKITYYDAHQVRHLTEI